MNDGPALVPELDVSNLNLSREFYVDLIGFNEVFSRPDDAFVYLRLGRSDLMLQQADGPGRRFRTAPLAQPYGRGINLQIAHPDLETAYKRLHASRATIVVPWETKTYRTGTTEVHVDQFVVADPDGYLIRLQREL